MKIKRKTQIVNCKYCGCNFEKPISEIKRTENRGFSHYCSRICGGKSRERKTVTYCKHCGKKTKSKIFCSQSCAASYNNKTRKGEKRNFSNKGIENIISATRRRSQQNVDIVEYDTNPNYCKECKSPLVFKHRHRVFCSIQCKRQYEHKNMGVYQIYHAKCKFEFTLLDYPNEFDFDLIRKYGWYRAKNHGDNLNGVSRDHMISIKFGYENKIDPEIIKHPANCQLLIHNNNSTKNAKCSILLDDLMKRIQEWNLKYN